MKQKQILYFTPSIEYASWYSPPYQINGQGKYFQVVFQCRVNLEKIKGKVGITGEASKRFAGDPHFKNSQIEWCMEPSRKVYKEENFRYACPETQCILTGLLIKESDTEPDYNKIKAKWDFLLQHQKPQP